MTHDQSEGGAVVEFLSRAARKTKAQRYEEALAALGSWMFQQAQGRSRYIAAIQFHRDRRGALRGARLSYNTGEIEGVDMDPDDSGDRWAFQRIHLTPTLQLPTHP